MPAVRIFNKGEHNIMKELKYSVSSITPLSAMGELNVILNPISAPQILQTPEEAACSVLKAAYHPFSQDLRLQVVWKEEDAKLEHSRIVSVSCNEQDQIIAAIQQGCMSQYGLSPLELIESARKEDERKELYSHFNNVWLS